MANNNYKYSLAHNWVLLKRKVASIGVTDYFLNELGYLIDINLPRIGDEIIAGISYGVIESIDEISYLIAPVNGEVMKVNTDLANKLKILQKDPFNDGWFIKVRLHDLDQLDTLMSEEEYKEYKKGIRKKKK